LRRNCGASPLPVALGGPLNLSVPAGVRRNCRQEKGAGHIFWYKSEQPATQGFGESVPIRAKRRQSKENLKVFEKK
jgi:hypothetical protein